MGWRLYEVSQYRIAPFMSCKQVTLMFGFFNKKAKQPKILYFKTPGGAFEYICKWMTTEPQVGHALPAIVHEVLSPEQVFLRMPDDHEGFINLIPTPIAKSVGRLEVGDFVMIGIRHVESKAISGFVIQVIEPALDLEEGIWLQKPQRVN